jgi:hypothetical protein
MGVGVGAGVAVAGGIGVGWSPPPQPATPIIMRRQTAAIPKNQCRVILAIILPSLDEKS